MSRKPNTGAAPTMPVAMELPEDGSPVEFRQTFSKHVASSVASQQSLSEDDYETSEWMIERLEASGWAAIDQRRGRPHKPMLRQMHGEGKFRVTPLDQTGKPLDALAKIELVGNPNLGPAATPVAAPAAQPIFNYPPNVVPLGNYPIMQPQSSGEAEMPAWMQMQMTQAAEERREARLRQDRMEQRQVEGENARMEREWTREERDRTDKETREARDREIRRESADRTDKLLMAGMALAEKFAGAFAQRGSVAALPAPAQDINAVLLQALLRDRDKPAGGSSVGSMRDFVEMFRMFEDLRGDSGGSEPVEESFTDLLTKAAPIIAMVRGGGTPDPAQIQKFAAEAARKILADPDAIAQFASEDPQGTAKVFLQAIQSNPTLEKAVMEALDAKA